MHPSATIDDSAWLADLVASCILELAVAEDLFRKHNRNLVLFEKESPLSRRTRRLGLAPELPNQDE